MNCLIVKNDGIGDLVLSSGVITSFAKNYKGSVDLITCIENKEVAQRIEGLNNIYYISRDSLDIIKDDNQILAYGLDSLTLKHIESTKYDHALVLRRFIRSSVFALMQKINADNKFCCWQFPTNISFTKAQELSSTWTHLSGSEHILNEALFFKEFLDNIFDFNIEYAPTLNTDVNNYHSILPKNKKLVALGVAGKGFEKDKWLSLINELISNDYTPVLIGGSDVVLDYNLVESLFPKAINLIGRINITCLMQELKNIEYYIGNDTGITHLASLFIPKCLVIYGGGTFGRFFPWPNSKNQYILYKSLGCFDCDWKCKYETNICLTQITTHDVLSYFLDITYDKAEKLRDLNNEKSDYPLHWQYQENIKSKTANTHDSLLSLNNKTCFSLKNKFAASSFSKPQTTPTLTSPNIKESAYIFGCGAYGKLVQNTFSEKYNILGFIDNNTKLHNTILNGLTVFSPAILENSNPLSIIIVASQYHTQIIHQLIESGISYNRIKHIPYKRLSSLYNLQPI